MRSCFPAIAALLIATPSLAQSAAADVHLAMRPVAPVVQDTKAQSYALIGGGIGAIAGLLVDTARDLFATTPTVCGANCTNGQARLSPPFGTSILVGAGVGLITGALIGKMHENDEPRVSVIPDAQRGTLTVSLRTRF